MEDVFLYGQDNPRSGESNSFLKFTGRNVVTGKVYVTVIKSEAQKSWDLKGAMFQELILFLRTREHEGPQGRGRTFPISNLRSCSQKIKNKQHYFKIS